MPTSTNGIEKDAAAILQNSELTRATWKDAVRGLFADGWKALSSKVPDTKSIETLVGNSVESADAGVMKLADLAVKALGVEKEAASSDRKSARLEQANALLGEIKSAFEGQDQKIDPSSARVLSVMRQIYVDPLDAITDVARKQAISAVREQVAKAAPILQQKLKDMSIVNRAILTVIGAAAAGVSGVASIYKPSSGGYTLTLPGSVVKQFPMIGRVGLQELVVTNNGLQNLAATVDRELEVKGKPVTLAASYRSALSGARRQDPNFSLSGKYTFYEKGDSVEAKVRASAERSAGGVEVPYTRASAGIEASRRDPGRFVATEADLIASKQAGKNLDLGYRATVEAGKTLKQNLDLSAYATVQSESLKSRPDLQTGVKLTQRFGAIAWPWENRRAKGNVKVSAALAGKLDGLKKLLKKGGKKIKRAGRKAEAALESAVAPEPTIQLPELPQIQLTVEQRDKSNVGWWIGGAVAVAAAAGGWWWWKHREG